MAKKIRRGSTKKQTPKTQNSGVIIGVLALIIIVLVLITVLALGGSNTSSITPQSDIINYGGDQIGPGQWNDQYHTEWFFTGNVKSKSGTKYSTVMLSFTAYDSSGAVVGSKNITTDMTDGMGHYMVVMKVTSAPDHINMTIINATRI